MNKIGTASVRHERSQREENAVISKNSENVAEKRQTWIVVS